MFMDKMVNKEVDEDVEEEMHQQEASDTSGTVGSRLVEQRPDRLTGELTLANTGNWPAAANTGSCSHSSADRHNQQLSQLLLKMEKTRYVGKLYHVCSAQHLNLFQSSTFSISLDINWQPK